MKSTRPRLNIGLDRFSGIYLWILFLVVFGFWAPHTFLTMSTLHSVASQQAIAGIVALAVLVPIASGHYDLSVGGTANLTGIVAILVQVQLHWNTAEAIAFSLLIGLLIGAANALVVVKLGVSSFIATLAMGSILSAMLVIVTGSQQPQPVVSTSWNNLTQTMVGGFQVVVVFLLAVAVILWWALDHTPAGRYIYATGGNPEAARLSGVRVDMWTAVPLIASGGIAGLAGILYTSLTGPSLSFGGTLLLPAFAAAFLGSTQLKAGKFNVWGTLVAIYVLATGVEGLQLVSGKQWLSDMFNGVALILAVALAVSRQRRPLRTGRSKAAADPDTDQLPDGDRVIGADEAAVSNAGVSL